jgi:membrane protein DedA with SNARE-associated domain
MNETLRFFTEHSYTLLFLSVLAQQLGLPLPSTPFILAAGVLARSGKMSLGLAIALALAAALLADMVWYEVGRRRGIRVLRLLCRISLEPDYCVRRTENSFARHGPKTLLIAKLVPGISAVATPLAGINRMSRPWFLLYDGGGSLLWIGLFMLLGFGFGDQFEAILSYSTQFGGLALVLVVSCFLAYLLWKFYERRRFLRSLRIARMQPQELKRLLDRGTDLLVVDLRHAIDQEADPRSIPGAVRMPAEEFDERAHELPLDRELVLFCT